MINSNSLGSGSFASSPVATVNALTESGAKKGPLAWVVQFILLFMPGLKRRLEGIRELIDSAAVPPKCIYNWEALKYASPNIRGDRATTLSQVSQYDSALQFASSALKSDIEIALAAIQQNLNAWWKISPELHREWLATAQDIHPSTFKKQQNRKPRFLR